MVCLKLGLIRQLLGFRPAAKSRALCQQGLKQKHGREHYGAFEMENLVQKILLQMKSALMLFCQKRQHLWQRHGLLLTKRQCKYGFCKIVFSFYFIFVLLIKQTKLPGGLEKQKSFSLYKMIIPVL